MGQKQAARRRKHASQATAAFTLVELLVVMLLSVLLLGLLFGPLVQSFGFTRKTQAITQAQDASRFTLERISRELAEAAYVFDNRNLPINFPIEGPNSTRYQQYALTYPGIAAGATPPFVLPVVNAKIDFIPAATLPVNRTTNPGAVEDPTTGGDINGAPLRLPLANGTRIIRYFVGLQRNLRANGTQEYYRNVYEFRRTDNPDLNPFVLYRAEFDPSDANLINPASPNSTAANSGGLNDPNFFYNTNVAANGLSYAQNWRAVSSPILAADRADLLVWQKDANKDYIPGNPVQVPVQFSSASIVGDTATPGFLYNDVSDAAGTIPSLYTARYGEWTLPYKITIYRGATDNNLTDGTSGALTLIVDANPYSNGPNAGEPQVFIDPAGTRGVLDTSPAELRYCFTSQGKLFIHTPNLTFLVDPVRGRVETGIAPILGNPGNLAPQMAQLNGTTTQVLDIPTIADGVALSLHSGDPITTVFRVNSRDPRAGTTVNDPTTGEQFLLPVNQGLLLVGLFEPRYYVASTPPQTLALPGVAAGVSPYAIFTRAAGNTGGIAIVSGSERVLAPAPTQSVNLVTYGRTSKIGGLLAKEPSKLEPVDPNQPNGLQRYTSFVSSAQNYTLTDDLGGTHANPRLSFDQVDENRISVVNGFWQAAIGKAEDFSGLPASVATDPIQRELQVTYLWQNNYARNTRGEAINASKQAATDLNADARAIVPEADVIKVDYSTRALINVSMGVRIYDANSGQPESIQVSDKVSVRNLGR